MVEYKQLLIFTYFCYCLKVSLTFSRDSWGLWYLFLLFGWGFFGNARKNNLEIPMVLIVVKVFKEFVGQDLLTEIQKLYVN